ncbi:MAG: hypothetical protein WC357_08770, partial [Candidatus Omnitrophota bacterium]
YRISKRLFDIKEKEAVALFAVSLAAFYHWPLNKFGPLEPNWFFGLSLSGMSEPIFYFFLFGGVSLFIDYVYSNRLEYLLPSALFLLLSTTLRYEGWIFAVAISMYLIITFARSFKEKRDWSLFIYAVLMNIFIPYRILDGYFRCRGYINKMLMSAESQSGLLEAIFFYPWVLLKSDLFIIITAAIGIALVFVKKSGRKTAFIYLCLPAVYVSLLICVSAIWGPIGFVTRPVAVIFLILIPFTAYAIFRILGALFRPLMVRLLLIAITVFIIFKDVASLDMCRSFGYASAETIDIVKKIKHLYPSGMASSNGKMLLELRPGPKGMVWDFMVFRLFAPDTVILDRVDAFDSESRIIVKDNPSAFDKEDDEFISYCKESGIVLLILTSDKHIAKVNRYAQQIGGNKEYRLFLLGSE